MTGPIGVSDAGPTCQKPAGLVGDSGRTQLRVTVGRRTDRIGGSIRKTVSAGLASAIAEAQVSRRRFQGQLSPRWLRWLDERDTLGSLIAAARGTERAQ